MRCCKKCCCWTLKSGSLVTAMITLVSETSPLVTAMITLISETSPLVTAMITLVCETPAGDGHDYFGK